MKLCMRTEKMFHRKIKSFKLVLLLENRNRQIYSDVYAIMLTIKCDHVSPSQNDDMKSNEKMNIVLPYSNNMHLRKIQDQKFSYVLIVLIWSTSRPMNSTCVKFFTQDNLHYALPFCSSHSNKFSSFNLANFFIFIASFSIFWRPMSIRMPSQL